MKAEELLSKIDVQIRVDAATKMMSLGKFIGDLEKMPEDKPIRMDFSYDGPGKMDSYRGFYNHLALMGTEPNNTVGAVLKDAKAALGQVFYGYKGGEFKMDKSTPLWWARVHSECHDTGVVGVTDEGPEAIIHTAYVVL